MAEKSTDKKELTIAERVASKIESRSARPVITDGKAARFDTRRYNNVDYTAEGQLSKRFVLNNEEAIAEKMAEGYDFPDNWDSTMPKIQTGGMVLMLRPKAIALRAQKFNLDHADALDSIKAPHDFARGMSPDITKGAEFFGESQGREKHSVPAGQASRVMGPD